MPVGRLVRQVADKSQLGTIYSWKRPFGVGFLVAGHDSTGPRLYQTCPSGNYYEYYAMAIGARSQASKTYLEKNFETFGAATVEQLFLHALRAVRASAPDKDAELTTKNCTLAVVGPGRIFEVLEEEALAPYIAQLAAEKAPPAAGGEPAEGVEGMES